MTAVLATEAGGGVIQGYEVEALREAGSGTHTEFFKLHKLYSL